MVDTAEPKGQFLAERNWFKIRFPRNMIFAPPIRSVMANIPELEMKTIREPDTIPGMVSGIVI